MSHIIIILDEINCIKGKLDTLKTKYDELKTYRDGLTEEPPPEIDEALHRAEHLAENICDGNDLEGYTLPGCIAEIEGLLT